MSFTSRLLSRLMHLPPAQSHDIAITRDIPIPMPDGVVLLADHYAPRGGSKLPTLLVRSPYGRKGFFSALTALPYAERGYQVLIQSCRGTAGSGGQFLYARHEHDDPALARHAVGKRQDFVDTVGGHAARFHKDVSAGLPRGARRFGGIGRRGRGTCRRRTGCGRRNVEAL